MLINASEFVRDGKWDIAWQYISVELSMSFLYDYATVTPFLAPF